MGKVRTPPPHLDVLTSLRKCVPASYGRIVSTGVKIIHTEWKPDECPGADYVKNISYFPTYPEPKRKCSYWLVVVDEVCFIWQA